MKRFAIVVVIVAVLFASSFLLVDVDEADASDNEYIDYSITSSNGCRAVKSIYLEFDYPSDLQLKEIVWNQKYVDKSPLSGFDLKNNRGAIAFSDNVDIESGESLVFLHFKSNGGNENPVVNYKLKFKNTTISEDDLLNQEDGAASNWSFVTVFGDKKAIQGLVIKDDSQVIIPLSIVDGDGSLLGGYSLKGSIIDDSIILRGVDGVDGSTIFIPSQIDVCGKKYSSKTIADRAFNGSTALEGKEVVLGEGFETIGVYSFSKTGLKSIQFPSTLKTIMDFAFSSCVDLCEIKTIEGIENKSYVLESITTSAFFGCTSLKKVSLAFGT